MLLMHDRTWKLDPSARHEQARRVGRFDYAAPGAMSMPDSGERRDIWNAYAEACDRHDTPGTYVPFPAMEMHPRGPGDRNLIFRDRASLPVSMREEVRRIYDLYGGREDSVLETHIGGRAPDLEVYRAPEEELVEVASAFGNAEWLLQRMLQAGYHPAITAASDLHLGLLGAPRAVEPFRGRFGYADQRLHVRDCGFGSGPVGALFADSCRRRQLWSSIKGRSGYATTGDRIYLFLDAGGYRMGALAGLQEEFAVSLDIRGQDTVERVDLVVGGYTAKSFFPGETDVALRFRFNRRRMPPGRWFYFRVKQTNWEYAWTAPVWFEDGEEMGDRRKNWPAWNHCDRPPPSRTPEMLKHLRLLERHLLREGDREAFGEIVPVGVEQASMGRAARFVSRTSREECPVTIRWFFEYQVPRIRIDWGYENFGVVDCQNGPAPTG
jgi:hypothetical protein